MSAAAMISSRHAVNDPTLLRNLSAVKNGVFTQRQVLTLPRAAPGAVAINLMRMDAVDKGTPDRPYVMKNQCRSRSSDRRHPAVADGNRLASLQGRPGGLDAGVGIGAGAVGHHADKPGGEGGGQRERDNLGV